MSERGLAVMGLLDNIRLAFASLWAGKMRALLTMLGIIIGIGSVIAILTVGDSLTVSINDSMQGLGVSNITVSLTEKTEEETEQADAAGVRTRIFGPSQPADEDLMTDEMIEEYRALFGDRVAAISLTESLGSGTAESGGIIGILLGLLLGGWAADLLGYAVRPSVSAMLGSAGFSMLIGIFFGYYPASKAAKLDPIDALRYE